VNTDNCGSTFFATLDDRVSLATANGKVFAAGTYCAGQIVFAESSESGLVGPLLSPSKPDGMAVVVDGSGEPHLFYSRRFPILEVRYLLPRTGVDRRVLQDGLAASAALASDCTVHLSYLVEDGAGTYSLMYGRWSVP